MKRQHLAVLSLALAGTAFAGFDPDRLAGQAASPRAKRPATTPYQVQAPFERPSGSNTALERCRGRAGATPVIRVVWEG